MSQERIYSPGEHIGPYQVVRVIATGGMGVVYETTPDPEFRSDLLAMGVQRLAVKVARLEALPEDRHAHKRRVERIDREFSTLIDLTKLAHKNVVRVYDSGWWEGLPYYAMEIVDGITLSEALVAQPRMGQILYVFAKLCGAVAFLHQGGICHRDLKPSNVLVRSDGGEPVLIDFGICLPPAERTLTGPQELLGTPTYLSPEYAAHWLTPNQTRPYLAAPTDDVWALGVMLYEILTGATPWSTPPSRHEALFREIQDFTPPHPTDVYAKCPRSVGDVAMRMLEKDFHKRPKDATEALLLLGAEAEGTDVFSQIPPRRSPYPAPPTDGGDGPAAPRRRRRPKRGQILESLATLMMGALLMLGVVYVFSDWKKAGGPAKVAGSGPSGGAKAATDPGTTQPEPAPEPDWGPLDMPDPPAPSDEGIAKGKPLPRAPYKDQLLAPCPKPYVEMIGACWEQRRPISPPYCTGNTYEVDGKCFIPVMDDRIPNSAKHEMDGGVP